MELFGDMQLHEEHQVIVPVLPKDSFIIGSFLDTRSVMSIDVCRRVLYLSGSPRVVVYVLARRLSNGCFRRSKLRD